MAMVYGEEHPPQSPAPGRGAEHHCRRVPSYEGQVGLEAVYNSVPPDQPETGISGGGSLCQQADLSVTVIYQLETRPTGNGHRCSHSGLDGDEGLCQPSMEPDWSSPSSDSPAASRACPSGTSMEGTRMLPSTAGNAGDEGSTPDSPKGEPGHSHT